VKLSLLFHYVVNMLVSRRWEIPIDGVMLDGQQLPASAQLASGSIVSALIDTVITFLRVFLSHPDADLSIVGQQFDSRTQGCC
jgi:hypothetical protein